jgi:homoserine dehydrogenase
MKFVSPATIVLKFGSSVLRSPASLPAAVAEIYRHYRDGTRVIAVVSAYDGITDSLVSSARAFAASPNPDALAALLSTGEIASAAHLTLAVQRAGVPAQLVDPRDIDLTAEGDRENATLAGLSFEKLRSRLSQSPVLIVPGFFAAHEHGGLALLGRGGSDMTALYLASELRLRCVLLKDVDGLYESDPAAAAAAGTCDEAPPPRRFALADYATAETCAGPLIQPRSIQFARERALTLDVARIGSSLYTRIGEVETSYGAAAVSRPIRVALLGLGTVGAGVLEYLQQFPERFELVAVLTRTPDKHGASGVPRKLLVRSAAELFACDPEIVVEALPGLEPARTLVGKALSEGLRVVTANKALIAAEWEHLAKHRNGSRAALRYAAAVGGAVPMVETVERLARDSRIVAIRGVLNGTSNFVLDSIDAGETLEDAIRSAQVGGLAEADPIEDLSGRDSERKLRILGWLAFGGTGKCDELTGIDAVDPSFGVSARQGRLRLVALAERTRDGYAYRVAPRDLALNDFLAGARGAENRLEIRTADGAVHRLSGLGAGRVPTATAVFADILEHARAIQAQGLGIRATADLVG